MAVIGTADFVIFNVDSICKLFKLLLDNDSSSYRDMCDLSLLYLTIWAHLNVLYSHICMYLLPSVELSILMWKPKDGILHLSVRQGCKVKRVCLTKCHDINI